MEDRAVSSHGEVIGGANNLFDFYATLVSVYPKIVSIRTLRNVILGVIRQRDYDVGEQVSALRQYFVVTLFGRSVGERKVKEEG